MNKYFYNTESNLLIEKLDKEFDILVVTGNPRHGHSNGWDLMIIDTRSEEEIRKVVEKIYNGTGRKA